jgi:hypothetical protein
MGNFFRSFLLIVLRIFALQAQEMNWIFRESGCYLKILRICKRIP